LSSDWERVLLYRLRLPDEPTALIRGTRFLVLQVDPGCLIVRVEDHLPAAASGRPERAIHELMDAVMTVDERRWRMSFDRPDGTVLPKGVDPAHVYSVWSLIHTASGKAVQEAVWSLFSKLEIRPAFESGEEWWLSSLLPGFRKRQFDVLQMVRDGQVREVMEE
jgi:hypothetical protein